MAMESSSGTWTVDPRPTYQWLRCNPDGSNCRPIPGADGPTYTPTADDVDHVIRPAASSE
jgi:hypothetical protein